MTRTTRRQFIRYTPLLLAAAQLPPWLDVAGAADTGVADAVAETTYGKVRGRVVHGRSPSQGAGVNVFKGIPYGGPTTGPNRFMPPTKPAAWTGVRDTFDYGPTAPQGDGTEAPRRGLPAQGEDCLVLNVFTPALATGKRPVMVWLHGGGFSTGSGSSAITEGVSLARSSDVVVVTINHRLNVFGFTHLAPAGELALSGSAGMLDIVSALQWVRDNIERFGGDPSLVTIFGQSGGGRKVATLMAMPGARGLFHRAVIESGAVLRLTTPEDGARTTDMLLAELGLKRGQIRELQAVPMSRLLAANAVVQGKIPAREPGMTANSPTIGSSAIPGHPWDPAAPALSSNIPLLIGYTQTEETFYDRPTAEKLALDEAGLKDRVAKRIGGDPNRVIAAFREARPNASPWDLWILIATDHPRGTYSRELARRKAEQRGAPVFLYRFDWETPEDGGHMRSPHTVEIPFVFNNIAIAGPLISKMPEAQALADRVSSAWVAFARSGNPNTSKLPQWPAYSAASRETMLFNDDSRVVKDPDRVARLAMEGVLKIA